MYIKRLQVEQEGFLAGLDVSFAPGLNVIIGARGTGKTSVIELVRFCLGAGGFTEDAVARGMQQARAILQGGAVTVEIDGAEGPLSFSRSASEYSTTTPSPTPRCTVLAQNEIEAVGAQAAGRMHLIDRYRRKTEQRRHEIERLTLELRSLTSQIQSVLAEGSNLAQQVKAAESVQQDLAAARVAQDQLLAQAKASDADRDNLSRLESAGHSLASRSAVVANSLDEVQSLRFELSNLLESPLATTQHIDDTADAELSTANALVRSALDHIRRALADLSSATEQFNQASQSNNEARRQIDEASRRLRQTLDAVQSGIGAASRKVLDLEERLGQLTALTKTLEERRQRYVEITAKRDETYERLDFVRDEIFTERQRVAGQINATLGPQIRATVIRSARTSLYEAAIVSALRGTGVHYNSLAPQVAKTVSPFELVKWAEEANVKQFAAALDITNDRAVSTIAALRNSGTAEIIASEVEDDVVLELLDGHDYKPTDRLSIGQRCTVILPVLLGQHGDPLLVDQPEDHLDNAFVADTLVTALRRRAPGDQFIFASHNANIPVLGEADKVIVLDSDGDRAFIAAEGALDDPIIVDAINRIMEGGRDAFAKRSAFYAKSPQP